MASINKTPSDMSTWVLGRGGADLNRQDVKDVQDGQKLLDQDLQGQGDLGEESGMLQLVWGVEVSLCSRMNDEGGCGALVQCTTSAECCTDDSFCTPLMEAVGRGEIKNSNLRAVTTGEIYRSR